MKQQKILILEKPYQVSFQEKTLSDLKPDQVLVRSVLSAFKHGTEMESYYGSSPFLKRKLDRNLRVFLDNPEATEESFYPQTLGNMTVGVVEKIGTQVTSFAVGDSVFGWLPIADWHVSSAEKIHPLGKMKPEQALCIDPATYAIGGALDGYIRYGEKVLITGLGAIGLLAIQYCKLEGATVYASSSFPLRRELAEKYGADVVLNSKEIKDLGLEIKQLTGGGVDLAIECSGRYRQLYHGIRATRQLGRVVCVGFYSGDAQDLRLGEEFFHNRITVLASLPSGYWGNPVRGEPPLHADDLQKIIIADLEARRLKVDGLLRPIYPFREAKEAIEAIANNPQDVVKVAIRY